MSAQGVKNHPQQQNLIPARGNLSRRSQQSAPSATGDDVRHASAAILVPPRVVASWTTPRPAHNRSCRPESGSRSDGRLVRWRQGPPGSAHSVQARGVVQNMLHPAGRLRSWQQWPPPPAVAASATCRVPRLPPRLRGPFCQFYPHVVLFGNSVGHGFLLDKKSTTSAARTALLMVIPGFAVSPNMDRRGWARCRMEPT